MGPRSWRRWELVVSQRSKRRAELGFVRLIRFHLDRGSRTLTERRTSVIAVSTAVEGPFRGVCGLD